MKTQLFQKIEFLLTLLEDRVESDHQSQIPTLLKEMNPIAHQIGGAVLEHFQDLQREAHRYLKEPKHLPALKERILALRNEFWEL